MKHIEKGVYGNSTMVFYTPSTAALHHLFFLNYAGFFHCNSNYHIRRKLNEMNEPYLFMLVHQGTMELDYQGRHFEAGPHSCLFFDSRQEHAYYTRELSVFQYVHFGGNLSDYYFQRITDEHRFCFKTKNAESLAGCLSKIEEEAEQSIPNEHMLSAHLHMLMSLSICDRENYITENSRRVSVCIRYMKEHITRSVTLEELADTVHLSPYYLTRLFKKYTDVSPGEFMLNLRLSHAKQLLVATPDPVYIISEKCGYQDPGYFVRIFKKKVGATPLQYRKMRSNLITKE